VDIFGSTSPLADAEILSCAYLLFKNIGFETINININDRQLLFNTLKKYENNKVNTLSIIQSIDKLDKISKSKIIEELSQKGLDKDQALKALDDINSQKPTANLNEITNTAINLGTPEKSIKFTPTLARGLDYYTGLILEITIPEVPIGSLAGGGRYDKLIEKIGGPATPAVGISFGLDRIMEGAKTLNLLPQKQTQEKILVTVFDKQTTLSSIKVASLLRKNKIPAELYPNNTDSIQKQLKYANKNGFLYVVIIGTEEQTGKKAILKNMETGSQETLSHVQLIEKLSTNE